MVGHAMQDSWQWCSREVDESWPDRWRAVRVACVCRSRHSRSDIVSLEHVGSVSLATGGSRWRGRRDRLV